MYVITYYNCIDFYLRNQFNIPVKMDIEYIASLLLIYLSKIY